MKKKIKSINIFKLKPRCDHKFSGVSNKGVKVGRVILRGLEGLTFPCNVYEMTVLATCEKCKGSIILCYNEMVRSKRAKKYQQDSDKNGF